MSAPGDGGKEGKRGFTKLIRRATKVLTSKRSSVSGPSTSQPSAPAVAASSATPPPIALSTPARPSTKATTAPPEASKDADANIMSAAAHSRAQEEKARAVFAKWGLTLEPGVWTPRQVTAETKWVEKTVRMRVHRQCHRCQTTFGKEKVCDNCTHTRCTKCPRFPAKRPKDAAEKQAAAAAAAAAVVAGGRPAPMTEGKAMARPVSSLVMPSKTGTDLVRKVPVHRVRRTCHKCETMFIGKATQCESCKHLRCAQCPRSPAKLKKWPTGYEGDVLETYPLAPRTLRKIRTRCRWECHSCAKIFMEHERVCSQCAHERCDDCVRHPPKRVKLPPDEAVVQSLYEKLEGVRISPAA